MGAKGKALIVPPFGKKDIEKIAAQVLEEYGDDVINKAIEEGKIVLPGDNIDVAALPHVDLNNITLEQFNAIKGKAFIGGDMVFYPSYINSDDDFYYIGFDFTDETDLAELIIVNIYLSVDAPVVDIYHYRVKDFGTKLYKHSISLAKTGAMPITFIVITTSISQFELTTKYGQSAIVFTGQLISADSLYLSSFSTQEFIGSIKLLSENNGTLEVTTQALSEITSLTDTVTEL